MYMYVHMQVGACVEAREENQVSSIALCLIPLKQGLSGNLKITLWLEYLAGKFQWFLCLHPLTPGLQCAHPCLTSTWLLGIQTQSLVLDTASPLAHGAISPVLSTCTLLGLENTCTSVIYHMFFAKPSKDFSKMLMDILVQYWQWFWNVFLFIHVCGERGTIPPHRW